MNTYTLGIDVSKYQDSNYTVIQPNFQTAYANGARFVIVRGASGPYVDEDFKYNYLTSKAAGLLRGVYHWLDYTTLAGLTAEQAYNKMASDARALVVALGTDKPELGIFADWERPNLEYPALPPYEISIAALRGWYSTVDAYMGSKTKVGLYGNYYVTIDNISPVPDDIKSRPLWIASYPVATIPLETFILETTFKPLIDPWAAWIFWQFSMKGSGTAYGMESGYVYLDVFPGTLDDLKAYAGVVVAEPELPIDEILATMTELEEADEALNIRLDLLSVEMKKILDTVNNHSNRIAEILTKIEKVKQALA